MHDMYLVCEHEHAVYGGGGEEPVYADRGRERGGMVSCVL
jgi:hypothetical protein